MRSSKVEVAALQQDVDTVLKTAPIDISKTRLSLSLGEYSSLDLPDDAKLERTCSKFNFRGHTMSCYIYLAEPSFGTHVNVLSIDRKPGVSNLSALADSMRVFMEPLFDQRTSIRRKGKEGFDLVLPISVSEENVRRMYRGRVFSELNLQGENPSSQLLAMVLGKLAAPLEDTSLWFTTTGTMRSPGFEFAHHGQLGRCSVNFSDDGTFAHATFVFSEREPGYIGGESEARSRKILLSQVAGRTHKSRYQYSSSSEGGEIAPSHVQLSLAELVNEPPAKPETTLVGGKQWCQEFLSFLERQNGVSDVKITQLHYRDVDALSVRELERSFKALQVNS